MTTTLVSGGAGFLGTHLCRTLLDRGETVVCVDNLSTGFARNIADLHDHPRFTFFEHDICRPFRENPELSDVVSRGELHAIANLASPASPPTYQRLAIETLMVGSIGMKNLLDLAAKTGARLLQASTSEVYGDPDVHPQPETYWGNVNTVGPRSMYDESKRFAEALCCAYALHRGVRIRLPRIFNTYGPGMAPDDGRVVTSFITQALRGEPLSVFGDGSQTRSFCFVDDEIAGLVALLDSDVEGAVNIGNPGEFTMIELAELVLDVTKSASGIEHHPLPGDDPAQRCPDITRATALLGWEPKIALREGLERTVAWFRTLDEFAN